jgi:DNA replication protein DnaC
VIFDLFLKGGIMEVDYDEVIFELPKHVCEKANLPKRFWNSSYRDVQSKIGKKLGYEYILNFKEQYKHLAIIGNTCTGKTTLAVAMLKQLIMANRGKAFYVSFPDILTIRKENKPIRPDEPAYTFWSECNNSDLLVVDNLGREVFSSFNLDDSRHILNNFLFTRFDNGQKTIFITHISDVDLFTSRYGDVFWDSLTKKTLIYGVKE